MKAIIFPGQGAQIVGMGKILASEQEVARNVFNQVDEALGYKLSQIIFEGPEELLGLTSNTQAALMAVSIALVKTFEHISGKSINNFCNVLAGHSLGQYTALCAASSIDVMQAAKMLKLRGDAMQSACEPSVGAMAACLGININELESIIEECKNDGDCEIANDNSLDQIVISGISNAVDKIILELKSRGKKAIKLNVSAPFHSKLMKNAANTMQDYLNNLDFEIENPSIPIIDNTTLAWLSSNENIKQLLVDQITGRVRWRQTMEMLDAKNFEQVIEFGPSPVLSKINQRSGYKFQPISLTSTKDIELYLEKNL